MAATSAHTRRYGIPTMLPRILSVRADQDDGVRDYEAFCQAIVELAQRKEKIPPLEPCDLAVAVGFLLGQLAVVEPTYDAEKERKPYLRFDLWLRTALYFDLIDFWRSPAGFGRHGQHRVAGAGEQGLDDAARAQGFDDEPAVDGERVGADRLVAAAELDPACRSDADRWLYPDPAGPGASFDGRAGRPASQALEGFVSGAGARAGGRDRRGSVGALGVAAPFVDCSGCGWRQYAQSPNGIAVWHYPPDCLACGQPLEVPA